MTMSKSYKISDRISRGCNSFRHKENLSEINVKLYPVENNRNYNLFTLNRRKKWGQIQ